VSEIRYGPVKTVAIFMPTLSSRRNGKVKKVYYTHSRRTKTFIVLFFDSHVWYSHCEFFRGIFLFYTVSRFEWYSCTESFGVSSELAINIFQRPLSTITDYSFWKSNWTQWKIVEKTKTNNSDTWWWLFVRDARVWIIL